MQELFEHRDFVTLANDLITCARDGPILDTAAGPRFLDLGCAPGGFSACLLQDNVLGLNSAGVGVSLPPQMGGFPMAIAHERLCVQFEDILGLRSEDLLCPNDTVHICVADAQNLSNFFKQRNASIQYRGLHAKSRSLGIWALTVKECELAFSKLRTGGAFVFRFGWRGVGSSDVHPSGEKVDPQLLARYMQEEEWYKALTHWLFSILKSLFSVLKPFKSEYVHQADVSFYMVCRNFDRTKYEQHQWDSKLQRAFHELSSCRDEGALVEGIKNGISDSVKAEIDELLEYVGRMRAIGIQSRRITNPKSFNEKFEKEAREASSDQDADQAAASKPEGSPADKRQGGGGGAASEASTSAENGYASSASTSQTALSSGGAGVEAPDTNGREGKSFPTNERSFESRGGKGGGEGGRRSRNDGKGVKGGLRGKGPPSGRSGGGGKGLPSYSHMDWSRGPPGPGLHDGPVGAAGDVGAASSWNVGPMVYPLDEQVADTGLHPRQHFGGTSEEAYALQQPPYGMFQAHPSMQEQHQMVGALHSVQGFHGPLQHTARASGAPRHDGLIMQQSDMHQDQIAAGYMDFVDPCGPASVANAEALSWMQHCGMDVTMAHTSDQASSSADCEWVRRWTGNSATAAHASVGEAAAVPVTVGDPSPSASSSSHVVTSSSAIASGVVASPAEVVVGGSAPSASSADPPQPAVDTSPFSVFLDDLASKRPFPEAKAKAPNSAADPATASGGSSRGGRGDGSGGGGSSEGDRQAVATKEREAGGGSDSGSSSEGQDGRKGYRHKKRAGRMVRERKHGRKRRDGEVGPNRRSMRSNGSSEPWYRAVVASLGQDNIIIHAVRFGLFCAMAWSMNSIIFSVLRLYSSASFPPST